MSQINLDDLKTAFEETKNQTAEPKPDGSLRDVNIKVMEITGDKRVAQKSGKEYIQMELLYRNLDFDKVETKKVAMFDTDQAEVVLGLEPGKEYVLHQIKKDGYWKLTGADPKK